MKNIFKLSFLKSNPIPPKNPILTSISILYDRKNILLLFYFKFNQFIIFKSIYS